jgi:hypothetical protein
MRSLHSRAARSTNSGRRVELIIPAALQAGTLPATKARLRLA